MTGGGWQIVRPADEAARYSSSKTMWHVYLEGRQQEGQGSCCSTQCPAHVPVWPHFYCFPCYTSHITVPFRR
eukprot:364639-Chlamydomonas_euryale.AAC.60